MINQIKDFVKSWNVLGVGLPTMKDPKTNAGSITATLVAVSCACVVISLISNKIDKSGAIEFYVISLGGYLGRKFQTKTGTVESNTKAP